VLAGIAESGAAMWVSPHHPPAEKRAYVMKRAGKRTVRPDRVVFGGPDFESCVRVRKRAVCERCG
jgi:hypothetical protein